RWTWRRESGSGARRGRGRRRESGCSRRWRSPWSGAGRTRGRESPRPPPAPPADARPPAPPRGRPRPPPRPTTRRRPRPPPAAAAGRSAPVVRRIPYRPTHGARRAWDGPDPAVAARTTRSAAARPPTLRRTSPPLDEPGLRAREHGEEAASRLRPIPTQGATG